MKKVLISGLVLLVLLIGFGFLYARESKDLTTDGDQTRMDSNLVSQDITKDNWRDFVLPQELTAADVQNNRDRAGDSYSFMKNLPWNTEETDPTANGNVQVLMEALREKNDIAFATIYIDVDPQDIAEDFSSYAGEMIYMGNNLLVAKEYVEPGSDLANAVTGGEGFGILTYESPRGAAFLYYLLPTNRDISYDRVEEVNFDEIMLDNLSGWAVGVDSEGRAVLAY